MSTLIDFVARAGNKLDRTLGHARNQTVRYTGNVLDRTLGRARKQVVNYTNGGGLHNDVRALRDLAAKPEVQGTLAAAAVIGATVGGTIASFNLAQGICEKHGYDQDNQAEPGMEGYTAISTLIIGGGIALSVLPMTAGAAYATAYDRAVARN